MLISKYSKCLALFCGLWLSAVLHGYSQDIPKELYQGNTIPDSLKEEANSVVRYSSEHYDILGPGKYVHKIHSIVTVLNEKGNSEAEVVLGYNKKYSNVSSFEMRIYDADGKLLKKYRKGDMYDRLAEDDETLVSDDRKLYLAHTIANYPTTVEITYERDESSAVDLGGWFIQDEKQSIQNAECDVTIAPDAGFRYLNKNTNIKPQKTTAGGKDVYTWHVSNLKAYKLEEGAMQWRVLPAVLFDQNKFNFYGNQGDITSWQNFGKWVGDLNADVSSLTPERAAEIKKMTDTIKTDKAKARFLYKYMQQNMRYVSIQLGIGGLKPFAASFVDQKKYGDCKALSNYMRALLKAVDINSYYTIINAGDNEEPADYAFPHNGFNHVILCIPFKNDTTWLECTSNTQPFGLLGPFTENRKGLMITENGGMLVSTPKSKAANNQFNSEVHVTLNADGGAKAQAKIISTGEFRNLFVDALPTLKADEQKEMIMKELGIKQPSEFDFQQGKDISDTKEVDLSLDYDKFCDGIAGDKQFIRPRVLALWEGSVPIAEKRKTDFYFKFPMQESCVTTIDLPAGYEVESLPVNSSLKFSYGNYDLSFVYNKDKNQVVSTAKFVLNNQVIPAAKYTEMQQYFDTITKAQNKKLVIKKKA
jgi:hypothetical protein